MFTLRIVTEFRDKETDPLDKITDNNELGNSYAKLEKGKTRMFDQIMDEQFGEYDKSEVKALVIGENGLVFFISESKDNEVYAYFIMSENGKTFEKL